LHFVFGSLFGRYGNAQMRYAYIVFEN